MMHSQSQTRIHSPFAALLQKDIRLASQLMLTVLIIVAAIAVIVTVLPLLGVVRLNDDVSLLQNLLAVLFPTFFFMAIVVPGWIAVALTFGDAQRRGSMLVSMLPVASRTKWISKLIVLIACTMLFAALTISVWYVHPQLEREQVTFKLIAWAIGIGLTAQLSGFATAAFTRSAVAAYAYQIGLLAAALITIIAFDWLVGRSALSLFTTSTAAIRVELGLDFDESSTFRNWFRAHEDLRQIGCLVILLLCALFCAWRGRGRVAGHEDSTRGSLRTLAWCIAIILLTVLIGNSIMMVQISSDYSKWTTELRKQREHQREHDAQAEIKSTAELFEESRNFTCQFRNTEQCEQILLYNNSAFRSITSGGNDFYRPDEPARGSWLDWFALTRRFETRPEEVIAVCRAIMHDSAGHELDQRFYAADFIGPEAVIGVALRALVDAATPCEGLQATIEIGARIDLRPMGIEVERRTLEGVLISFSDLPPFAFREADMQFPTCVYRARAIMLVTALRRHCASRTPRASEVMAKALAEFGIDDATLDKCRAILEAPLLESWESLERKAAGGEEQVLERLKQFKVCLDCNGSAFFNRAETDPVYLIADR